MGSNDYPFYALLVPLRVSIYISIIYHLYIYHLSSIIYHLSSIIYHLSSIFYLSTSYHYDRPSSPPFDSCCWILLLFSSFSPIYYYYITKRLTKSQIDDHDNPFAFADNAEIKVDIHPSLSIYLSISIHFSYCYSDNRLELSIWYSYWYSFRMYLIVW